MFAYLSLHQVKWLQNRNKTSLKFLTPFLYTTNPLTFTFTPKSVYYYGEIEVILTSGSVDEIIWCHRSNETYSAVLSHGATNILVFCKTKIGIVLNFDFSTLGSERVKTRLQISFDTYMFVYLLIVHSLFRPGIYWWERGRSLPHPLPRPPALSQAFIITYFSPVKAREGQNRYNYI